MPAQRVLDTVAFLAPETLFYCLRTWHIKSLDSNPGYNVSGQLQEKMYHTQIRYMDDLKYLDLDRQTPNMGYHVDEQRRRIGMSSEIQYSTYYLAIDRTI